MPYKSFPFQWLTFHSNIRTMHRRHSSRSIKRKKFDDELVESSLPLKAQRKSFDGTDDLPSDATSTATDASITVQDELAEKKVNKNMHELARKTTVNILANSAERKPVRKKKIKKTRQAFAAVKDMGRWKPTDDILLVDAVTQVQDLTLVHRAVKFSCYFTLEEVQERWYALLYDPVISGLARQAMKALPKEVVQAVHALALYSKDEEKILAEIVTSSQPTISTFQDVLDQHISVFHHSRNAAGLKKHWDLMKSYNLLEDQAAQPLPQADHILSFSDAEDTMDDQELLQSRDEALESELKIFDRKQKQEIKKLEEELPRWEALVNDITGTQTKDMDQHTVAVLKGRLVRYLMRSREITFGRSTEYASVDIDLSLEGPAYRISRRQGCIRMKNNGEFVITNEGKRPIYVDGKVILKGSRARLHHESIIEIVMLRFVFLVNQNLIPHSSKSCS